MSDKIEKVERFATTDDALFETMEEAERHQSTLDLKDFLDTCDIFYTRSSGTVDIEDLYQGLAKKPVALQLARILYKIATDKDLVE